MAFFSVARLAAQLLAAPKIATCAAILWFASCEPSGLVMTHRTAIATIDAAARSA